MNLYLLYYAINEKEDYAYKDAFTNKKKLYKQIKADFNEFSEIRYACVIVRKHKKNQENHEVVRFIITRTYD